MQMLVAMKNLIVLVLVAANVSAFAGTLASFTPDKSAGCPPLVVNFTDHSAAGTSGWSWDFGNGNKSNLQNPSATYLNPGVYTVILTIFNNGHIDTATRTITVFKLPQVNFTVANPNTCLNDSIVFQSNVTLGDAPIANYGWGFGNGTASSNPNAVYTYSDTGVYSITLVVQDSNGCSANETKSNYITIKTGPSASFTASPPFSCLDSQLVTFTNTSTGVGLSYLWNLTPSVQSTLQNPSYTYQQGTYTAQLTVTDQNGCTSTKKEKIQDENLSASFIASKTLICVGQQVQFSNTSNFQGTNCTWDFGDGTTSTDAGPIKTYSKSGLYTIKLAVYNGNSCADSITKIDYISVVNGFAANTASFTADSTTSCGTALPVNFQNTTPVPGDVTYHWDFGNGDTSNVANPNEQYNTPGNFTVTLTITDTSGCTVTVIVPNYIQTAPPTAEFVGPTTACPNLPVQFGNRSSTKFAALWNFGDGDTSTQINPYHQYKTNGSYTVALTATNAQGCSGTTTTPNFITVDTMHVDFSVSGKFSPCPPFVVEYTNRSAPGATGFYWNFGDGYTDTASNPTHIYFYPGVYSVTLYAAGVYGCHDSITYQNLITVQGPTGTFSVTPTSGCTPLQVNLSASITSNTQTSYCDLGDGTVLNDSLHILHTYSMPRVYHPQYVLTDHEGCTVSYPLDSITVFGNPILAVSDTSVCAGAPVTVFLSKNPYKFQWSPSTYLNCDTCSLVTITPGDTITYHISASNGAGCSANVTMQVNAAALPVLNHNLQVSLCKDDQYSLYVGDADSLVWYPSTYLSNATSVAPVCTPDSSIQYTVSAFNSLGCLATATVPVTVKTKVEVTIAPEIQACAEGNVQLQSKLEFGSDLGVNYNWSPQQILNNPTIADPIAFVGSRANSVQLIATSGHCIPDTQTVSIDVQPLPDITVSEGVTTTINAETPLFAASHQDLTYTWSSQDSLSCTDCARPNVYPKTSGLVYVEGVNAQGCAIKDSIFINVVGCDGKNVYLPNTFTPNGDGVNDKFYVRSNALTNLKYFRIYDAWGQTVFETDNLSEGWDGTVAGRAAPLGVYVYELQATCQNGYDVIKTGNVTAVR
jgi:gliding motility-associated-like protein